MSTINVTYKYIDGAHFFVTDDKEAAGLCVAHEDLKTAFNEVANQLNVLFEHNHGQKTMFTPKISFEKFKKLVQAYVATAAVAEDSDFIPASIQPWVYNQVANTQ